MDANEKLAYGKLFNENAALTGALEEIRAVASGEQQLDSCFDDTETLAWVCRAAEAVLNPVKECVHCGKKYREFHMCPDTQDCELT
jgi:hypothetical protein